MASLVQKAAPTEITSARTTYSDTYDNHDGTYMSRISAGPINYKPTGSSAYQPIDTTLAAISGGKGRMRAAHTATPVEVGAPDDAAGFLSFDTGHGKLALHLAPGAKAGIAGSKPSGNRSEGDVAGLMPNVDLRAVVDNTGVSTFFVLKSAPASPSLTLALDTGGLTPALQSSGDIWFLDKGGNTVAIMPAPYAVDSSYNAGLGSGAMTWNVHYSLATQGATTLISVNVDSSWLAKATYPVYVDPSFSGTTYVWDNSVYSNASGSVYKDHQSGGSPNWHEMLSGVDPIYGGNYNDYVRFDLSSIANATVDSASLSLYYYHQYVASKIPTWIYVVDHSWNPNTLTYANAPTASTYLGYKYTYTATPASFTATALTSTVQGWVSGTIGNYGLQFNENGNGKTYWKRLVDSKDPSGLGPALVVTWHWPTVAYAVPAAGAWTNSRALSWSYSDSGGAPQASYRVLVSTSASFPSPYVYDSGTVSGTTTSVSIPTNATLTSGTTYYWKAIVTNGSGVSSDSGSSFKYDPVAPVFAPSNFTAPTASQTDVPSSPFTFKWNAATDPASGVASVAPYAYQLNSAQITATNTCPSSPSAWTAVSGASGAQTSLSYAASLPTSGYCYELVVSAKDNANNVSAAATSNPVLFDSNLASAMGISARLTDNCAQIGSCYRTDNKIYFRPAAALTITLTSSGVNDISGIASSTFSALDNTWVYSYTPGVPVPGAAAQALLTWSAASTTKATLSVYETDGAGVVSSPPLSIDFIPDPGAKADFSSPVAGQTNYAKPGAFQVKWAETQGSSPITARSTQREVELAGSGGNCSTSGWAADGQPVTSTPPITATLVAGNCYEWIETLTDALGDHPFTSAPVFVDNTAPVIAISSPSANAPLSGTVAITGTATDDAKLATWTLSYGAGTSPTSWTPIGTPGTSPVAGGSLGSWATGSLPSGVYTLQLTAVDAAGNAPTPATVLVYLDNTDRGIEPYYTNVPLDMGGLKLGVNVATGEATISRNLFDIPSYGPDQSLSLSYNSGQGSAAGMFGTGWSSNLTQYLDTSGAGATGGFIIWHESDGGQVPFGSSDGTTWKAMAGHFETLTIPTAGKYTISEPDHSSYAFADSASSTAKLSAITDANGNALTFHWPSGAGTATATDAGGRITSMTVNSAGQITDVTDSAESSPSHWVLGYHSSALSTISDPQTPTNVTTFTPYAAGACPTNSYTGACLLVSRQLKVSNPDGTSTPNTVNWTIEYNASDQVSAVVDPIEATKGASDTFVYNYDDTGSIHHTVVSLARDISNSVITYNVSTYYFTPPDNTNPAGRGYVYEIDQVADSTHTWAAKYTYDTSADLLSRAQQIDQSGHWATTTYADYDAFGYAWTETDPIGITTKYTYSKDGYHDLTDKIVSGGTGSGKLSQETQYNYTNHLLTSQVENLNGKTSPVNVTTGYTYYPNGQLETETNPLGYVTAYTYDQTTGDKTSSIADCVGTFSPTTAKCGGTPDDTTDVTTVYTYNADGTLKTETDPIAAAYVDSTGAHIAAKTETTTYVYDAMGNQLTETKPGDNGDNPALDRQTVNTYDSFGDRTSSLSQVRTAGTQSWTGIDSSITTNDLLGRSTTVTDTTTTASTSMVTNYDLAGNVVLVSSQGTSSAGVVTASATTKTYDGLGRVQTQHEAGQSDTQYTYDGLADVTQTISPAGSKTIDAFDFDGNLLTDTANYDSTQQPNSEGGVNALTTHHLDVLGREYSKTDPSKLQTDTHYDGLGRVLSSVSTDPSTSPVTVTETDTAYDSADEVLSTISAHNPGGPSGTVTSHTFDALGREITTTAPDGTTGFLVTTTTYYDSADNAVATVAPSVKDPTKLVVNRTIYNVQGEAVTTINNCTDSGTTASTDPGHCTAPLPAATHDSVTNLVTTNAYGLDGTKISSTSVVGTIETQTKYDGAGRVLTSTVDPGTDGLNLVTTYTFDAAGRQKTQTSPMGVVQDTIYNASGKVCRIIANSTIVDPWSSLADPCTTALGTAKTGTANLDTTYTYDNAGNKTSQTDPAGTLTAYTYDTAGHLRKQDVTPAGATAPMTTLYYYNASSQELATATSNDDGTAAITRYVYDDAGHLIKRIDNCIDSGTTDPATCVGTAGSAGSVNVVTTYSYDAAGNKIGMTAPSPVGGTATITTLYAYDANTHLCRVLESATIASLQALAIPCVSALPSGTPISATQNVDTQYTYDTAGNMASQVVPADTLQPNPPASYTSATTTYKHDEEGRLISETDPDGNVSGSTPSSHTTTYTFDVNGNKATETQPDGQKIAWYYDAANRLCQQAAGTSLTTPAHPCTDQVGGATLDTIYTHDKAGNMLAATDPLNPLGAQVISATYDAQNRPLTVGSKGGPTLSASPTDTTTYTYPDTATETRTDPTGVYSFNIDGLGRETSMADPLHTTGSQYSWAYGLSGKTTSVSDPSGVTTCYAHDPLGHLISTSTAASAACANPVSLYGYAYNAAGNQTSATTSVGTDPTNGTTNYSYDPLGRLTGYTLPTSSPVASSSQSYGWNAMPDRASVTTGSNPLVTTYFDAAGRPLSDTAVSGNTYSSNGNGQITGTPANTTTSTPGETLKYDDLGRLSEVDVAAYANKPSSTETYAYDPLGRLQTVSNGVTTRFIYVGLTNSVAEEVDGAGNVLSKHATDLAGTELFDFTSSAGTTVSYLGRDAHGDVTYTRDQTGTISSTAAYDPFGNVIATSGSRPSITDTAWQGNWFDGQTHLYYVEARWYSPTLGQFLSLDPLTADATDPQARDPYPYGAGDPVDRSDPSGMQYPWQDHVQQFSQDDPAWESEEMAGVTAYGQIDHGCGHPIGGRGKGGEGCAITAVATVLNYMGKHVSIGGVDEPVITPGILNEWLSAEWKHKLISPKTCDISWTSSLWRSTFGVQFHKSRSYRWAPSWESAKNTWTKVIMGELAQNRLVIAQVTWGSGVFHNVVIAGVSGGAHPDFLIADPAKPPHSKLSGLFASSGNNTGRGKTLAANQKASRYQIAHLILYRQAGCVFQCG